jgi:formylglycine-generating enzyme required for sulfatase activity
MPIRPVAADGSLAVHAGGTGAGVTGACQSNLTCARQARVISRKDFTYEVPDLSRWELVTVEGETAVQAVASGAPRPSARDPLTGMELVRVPGACYRLPPPIDPEPTAPAQESPAPRTVCIDPFDIGAHEVTFDEYDRFARATGLELPDDEGWGRGRRPVINVSIYDAMSFAKWLSRQTGARYRLPTEVEWEHAARAGAWGTFPWGDALGSNRANCDGCGSRWDDESTAPVGSFAPNAWGIHDVVGNVGEWTCSMRDPDPSRSFESCDSLFETRRRVYRNGGWSDSPERLGTAFRDWNAAFRRTDDVGFRLVRECGGCRAIAVGNSGDRLADGETGGGQVER